MRTAAILLATAAVLALPRQSRADFEGIFDLIDVRASANPAHIWVDYESRERLSPDPANDCPPAWDVYRAFGGQSLPSAPGPVEEFDLVRVLPITAPYVWPYLYVNEPTFFGPILKGSILFHLGAIARKSWIGDCLPAGYASTQNGASAVHARFTYTYINRSYYSSIFHWGVDANVNVVADLPVAAVGGWSVTVRNAAGQRLGHVEHGVNAGGGAIGAGLVSTRNRLRGGGVRVRGGSRIVLVVDVNADIAPRDELTDAKIELTALGALSANDSGVYVRVADRPIP